MRRSCELSDLIPPQMFLSDIITQFDGEEGITIEGKNIRKKTRNMAATVHAFSVLIL